MLQPPLTTSLLLMSLQLAVDDSSPSRATIGRQQAPRVGRDCVGHNTPTLNA